MSDDFDEDDELPTAGSFVFFEFDCTDCDANNPVDDGLRTGDLALCSYCGLDLQATVSDEGKLTLREAR